VSAASQTGFNIHVMKDSLSQLI